MRFWKLRWRKENESKGGAPMSISLEFTYAGFEIEEPIGESPQLVLKIDVNTSGGADNARVYITRMACAVKLYSTETFDASSRSGDGYLGTYETVGPISMGGKDVSQVVCHIPVTGPKLDAMSEIRARNKLVCLDVKVSGLYFVYDREGEGYLLKGIHRFTDSSVKKFTPTGEKSNHIVFTSEEFTELVREIKHFDLLRIEIPVYKFERIPDVHVNRALELMKNAYGKLIQCNYPGALVDIRNSILNHLTEIVTIESKRRRVLRNDIKESVLNKVPQDLVSVYGDVLGYLQNILTSTLNSVHKFVHEDSDKLRLAPLREDAELAYFTTMFATRYLAQLIT